jgi:hypothetical protein
MTPHRSSAMVGAGAWVMVRGPFAGPGTAPEKVREFPMKVSMPRAAACLVLGGLLASTAAAQNKVDLDRTTCKQFLEMPRDYTLVVLGWLQGYYLEENAEPVVDIEKVFADLLRLTEHCQGRPDEELMAAAEELFGKQAPAPPQAESPAPPR